MDKFKLLYLASLLDNHKDNGVRFDLRTWMKTNVKIKKKGGAWCGTAACAIGLAMLDKNFQAIGFGIDTNGGPAYDVARGTKAVCQLFDIPFSAVDYLFMPASYPRQSGKTAAKAVAKRIREFVASDGVVPSGYPLFNFPAATW